MTESFKNSNKNNGQQTITDTNKFLEIYYVLEILFLEENNRNHNNMPQDRSDFRADKLNIYKRLQALFYFRNHFEGKRKRS